LTTGGSSIEDAYVGTGSSPARGDGPLRAGIIGTGFIGAVHATALRRAGAQLVGVVASTPASTADAVAGLGADRAFDSVGALVNSPEVDVVHICTPNHLHRGAAEEALAAGKHVVCEKPLSVTHEDARWLTETAANAGVVATVPFVYRFYPMVREARARISRHPGSVRLVHGRYLQDWLSSDDDYNWRVDAERSGPSRAFADIGSHWCDLIEFVTGDRIHAVNAELVTVVPQRRADPSAHAFEASRGGDRDVRDVTTEDVALVLFRTAAGVSGSLVVSQVSPGHKNQLSFEISTGDATVVFDQERPDTLWIGGREANVIVTRDVAVLDPSAAAYVSLPPGHPQGYADAFAAFIADTYAAIGAGSTASVDGIPTFADGARAVQVTDAVLRSAGSGRWEQVELGSLYVAEGGGP
jgi:predicted dehydrogenase